MEQSPPTVAKRMWHILRVVYYMIRKGFSKHKLAAELGLLLKRGKIAGKALGNLLTFHHHHHHHSAAAWRFSCSFMDPNLSIYNPRGVEFSCSNTPNYPARRRESGGGRYELDAPMIAKAFEALNSEALSVAESSSSVVPSPSPVLFWNYGKSPAAGTVRQLRITDSPFPMEDDAADGQVDVKAEEFIRRFYEDLQLQRTPENHYVRRKLTAGRA